MASERKLEHHVVYLESLAYQQQEGEQEEQEGGGGQTGGVAQVALAEAHEHSLVVLLDIGAPLLVVAGRPLQALPLRGDPEVIVAEVLVPALEDLGAAVAGILEWRWQDCLCIGLDGWCDLQVADLEAPSAAAGLLLHRLAVGLRVEG